MMPMTATNPAINQSNGARLVSTDGKTLPLKSAALATDACAGLARVVLTQTFVNPYDEPLVVTYALPLPHDGAVSAFAFTIGGRRVTGEIDRRAAARERFERALVEGRSAALLEQDRASLFTQEIGNIPPKSEIVAEITIDQRLAWNDEGAWEWRFPTVVMPRYLGASNRVPDADKITQDVTTSEIAARATMKLTIRDALSARPESPSHSLVVHDNEVSLSADGGVALDRDLVVRWAVSQPKIGASIDTGRRKERTFGLVTLVPPLPTARKALPRDLVLLLDISGSMSGEPLDQARKVCAALVQGLTNADRIEMIAFSDRPRRWKKHAETASEKIRAAALEWLAGLEAGGGTEMRDGIMEALTPLRPDAQRQVVLVTDGAIGFEQEIVAAIREHLPAGSRVHTIGVGSGVNRSLTAPAARAGRGCEIVIGLGEDPERAARRLCARTQSPLVQDVSIEGSAVMGVAPRALPDLLGGAPALVGVELNPAGGELVIRGRSADGVWQQRLTIGAIGNNAAVATLYGREMVEDLETALAAGGSHQDIDQAIEKLGLEFQIATRLTSWVAVSDDVTVDPRAPHRREKMPHQLPHGVSAEGLGLRACAAPVAVAGRAAITLGEVAASLDDEGEVTRSAYAGAPPPPRSAPTMKRMAQGVRGFFTGGAGAPPKDEKQDDGFRGEMPAERERGISREEPEQQEQAKAPQRPSGFVSVEKKKAAPTVVARLVSRKGKELVLEILVGAEVIDWHPEHQVTCYLPDGTVATARLDLGRTTKAAPIGAGLRIRIVLVLDREPTAGTLTVQFGELHVIARVA
jgi:Ca-activated chloride channel family protein